MKFKGTKGKWHFEYPGGNSLARLFNEEGEEILNFGSDYDYYPTEGLEPNDYDALLISKAPEMLEMLEMWCMDMEELGKAYGDCYNMTKDLLTRATTI